MPLTVVALVAGELGSTELHTLQQLAPICALRVIHAAGGSEVSARKRLRRLVRDHGVVAVASRLAAGVMIGRRESRRQRVRLDRLFDAAYLREWWTRAQVLTVAVPGLNHADARAAIASLSPDLIIRVSGGILKPATFSLARIATLNIHHGRAHRIRGMWSIPWAIVEGQRAWIGATIHVIDAGIDTGPILWCGAPQVAPGATGDELFFRTHLEAVDALVHIVEQYGRGETPAVWTEATTASHDSHESPGSAAPTGSRDAAVYRSAPGLPAWLRYLALGRGRRARAVWETAIKS